jgi:hypothetical protein
VNGMKTHIRLIFISVVIGFGFLCIQGAPSQKRIDLEKRIWQLEESYWEYWIKGDIEDYMFLLHKDFIGWPSSDEKPSDKKAAREFVQNYLAQTKPFAFEIQPAAIRIITNVSIVHYILIWKDKEGNQIGDSYRITHTWLEQDGNWKVIGGMSSKMF